MDTITIDRAEYDSLVAARDELEDLRSYDRVKAAIESGADELVPAAFAARLVAGESPVRVWRELRGLTQTGLADLSGVNRVQIVEIEAGRKTGSVETLRKLANALEVTLDDMV